MGIRITLNTLSQNQIIGQTTVYLVFICNHHDKVRDLLPSSVCVNLWNFHAVCGVIKNWAIVIQVPDDAAKIFSYCCIC